MSVDDPGWEGYSPFGQEPTSATPPAPQAPPGGESPDASAAGYDEATGYDEPTAAAPVADSGYTPPRPGAGTGGSGRQLPPRNVLIGAGAAVLVVLIVVVTVVAGGGSNPKKPVALTTPVTQRSTVAVVTQPAPISASTVAASTPSAVPSVSPSGVPASSPASTAAATDTSAKLLTVVPDGLTGTCQDEPKADWLSATTTDELTCLTQAVPNASAVLVGFARQKTAGNVTDTFNEILKLNGFKADTGACAAGNLVGTTATGSYCESPYKAVDGTTGRELLYDGQRMNVGGASGETTTFCQEAYPGSTGISLIAYTDPDEHDVVIALNCNTAGNLLSGLQAALDNGVYALND